MILYCLFVHIIWQLKTKLKKTSNPLVNYLIQLMKWWNGFSKYGQVQDLVETVFMSTGSPEQLELFRYNSKKVFDVYISKVYPVVQDEMDFTF